ncbi:MAG: anaerobic ribonucleoside-triphosphate reductase activating protein [Candidatus Marinimicrobia bacterium]|nr:anaerobic ribonucleoside-triphosphate reductase activating protein [Candidatus Neomarinimicrobiota bacterium]
MKIGGFQKFSLIDYPGLVSAIIFTYGCNFRCSYCQNPELINESFQDFISEDEIFDFLKKRKSKIDGVVITGGEPLIQNDLPNFIYKIKLLDYKVKIDTNGSIPHVIKDLISKRLIDYIAMDVKAPFDKYNFVINVKTDYTQMIKESIKLIMNSGLPYEFRTTYIKQFLSYEDVIRIAKSISGADLFVIQKLQIRKVYMPDLIVPSVYEEDELKNLKNQVLKYVKRCLIR